MKNITNWRKASVCDLESDGLLLEATKIHTLALQMQEGRVTLISGDDKDRVKTFFNWHITNGVPVVFHNGICFDIPLCEKLLDINLDDLMVIDTLALSWYLNVKRKVHGLDSFHRDYGIKKPVVSEGEWREPERLLCHTDQQHDTEVLRHEALMEYRVTSDVKINKELWEDLKSRLVSLYTLSKGVIDSGRVGGKTMGESEVTYLDRFVNTTTVEEWVDNLLTFLMMKMDNIRIKEKTMWEVDVVAITAFKERLDGELSKAKEVLESVMPQVPQYSTKKFPKKPVKKGRKGSDPLVLSATGESWNEHVGNLDIESDLGHPIIVLKEGFPNKIVAKEWTEGVGGGVSIKVLSSYTEPNAGSPDQIKAFLFSRGWSPETFEEVEDAPAMKIWEGFGKQGRKPDRRAVPQISKDLGNGKELCPSVVKLAEKVPEIMAYQKYTTIKHRRDMVKGWLKNIIKEKYLIAGCGGFTSTLREQHRILVNLVGVDKLYGKDIRGGLVAGEGNISLGSDLSSLEDRVKHHFMLPHDPEYVSTMMADDYDPHLLTAFSANMITEDQFNGYKQKTLSKEVTEIVTKARKAGKATNYSSVYGARPPTIAKSAGVPIAQGEQLFGGYWKLNWAVTAIAEEQVVITCEKGMKWLVNPLNGLCYSLRDEKDRFSALCQGTGSYLFDLWVDNLMTLMKERWGVKRLNGLFHDELITSFRDTPTNRESMEDFINLALEEVNRKYLLRRKLGCDVQFGVNYSQIH